MRPLVTVRLWSGGLCHLAAIASAFQNLASQQRRTLRLGVLSSPVSATVDIREGAPRDVYSMDEWATAYGLQKAPGLELTTLSVSDDGLDVNVGFVTNQDLTAGQPVLVVPNTMTLSGSKARQELGVCQAAEDLLSRMKIAEHIPQFYLFLKVLWEYQLGDQSPWFPWLNSLPRYFSNGSSMTQFCTSECLPPLVGSLANKERVRLTQFVRALEFVPFLDDHWTKKNRALAKWAFAIVYTRSFPSVVGDVAIAPMADMFNHGTQTEIELSYDEQGNCYACTTYDVPAGSPLRMSYGDPTNPSHLFARYGFLDETSPATFCKLVIANPSKELIDMGYDHSKMLFYKDTGDVSQEVWDVLLYQILEKSNNNQHHVLHTAHMNGDFETKQALHSQYSAETTAALVNHVDSFLRQLDDLALKAINRDPRDHPRLPLIRSHNEFVRNTFLTVRSRLFG